MKNLNIQKSIVQEIVENALSACTLFGLREDLGSTAVGFKYADGYVCGVSAMWFDCDSDGHTKEEMLNIHLLGSVNIPLASALSEAEELYSDPDALKNKIYAVLNMTGLFFGELPKTMELMSQYQILKVNNLIQF